MWSDLSNICPRTNMDKQLLMSIKTIVRCWSWHSQKRNPRHWDGKANRETHYGALSVLTNSRITLWQETFPNAGTRVGTKEASVAKGTYIMFEARIWENLALSKCCSNVFSTWTLPLDKAMGYHFYQPWEEKYTKNMASLCYQMFPGLRSEPLLCDLSNRHRTLKPGRGCPEMIRFSWDGNWRRWRLSSLTKAWRETDSGCVLVPSLQFTGWFQMPMDMQRT